MYKRQALDLTEDTYMFLYKHIDKIFKSDNLVPAIFNDERNIVREISEAVSYTHLHL